MSTIAVRVDDQLKQEASVIISDLGLDMSTAVKMYLKQIVVTRSIPFDIKLDTGISDKEFQKMVEQKIEGRRINFSNPEDVEDFFGDEDFSEYEGVFNE